MISKQSSCDINFENIIKNINSTMNKALTDNLLPIIHNAKHNQDQYAIVTNLLKQLPEFQNLIQENAELKLKLHKLTNNPDVMSPETDQVTLEIKEKDDTQDKNFMFSNIQNIISSIENKKNNTPSSSLYESDNDTDTDTDIEIKDREMFFANTDSPTFPTSKLHNRQVLIDNEHPDDDDDDEREFPVDFTKEHIFQDTKNDSNSNLQEKNEKEIEELKRSQIKLALGEEEEEVEETGEEEEVEEEVEETGDEEEVEEEEDEETGDEEEVEEEEVDEEEVEEEEVDEEEVEEEEVGEAGEEEDEEGEEDDGEGVFLCELEFDNKLKEFYITDELNGEIYEVGNDDDVGELVGKIVDGIPEYDN